VSGVAQPAYCTVGVVGRLFGLAEVHAAGKRTSVGFQLKDQVGPPASACCVCQCFSRVGQLEQAAAAHQQQQAWQAA
jgi:hypothetical protein